jgi:tetratricopeptide (TPR) repeat protein
MTTMKNLVPQIGSLPANPSLSVCMIVRDEEKVLPRCLESVEAVADELIVVDTGSQDETVSIAKDYSARVYHFEWGNDFAAARNEALEHAKGDWILQMDADEEILPESSKSLERAMQSPWHLLYGVRCDNGPEAFQRFNWISRLFRNHPGVRYQLPYHETVELDIQAQLSREPRWQVGREPSIIIRHYGYEGSELLSKLERGLPIMERYLEGHPDNWYMLTQLGRAYCGLGRYDEAGTYLQKSLELNPDQAEAIFTMGSIAQHEGQLEEAIRHYEKAAALNPLLAEADASAGAIYLQMGITDSAISRLKRALSVNPEMAMAHGNLGWAYANEGSLDASIEELKTALALDPQMVDGYLNLGTVYDMKGMLDEALTAFKAAKRIDPADQNAQYNLAIVYHKKGCRKEAVQHLNKARRLGAKIEPRVVKLLKRF